MRGTPRETLFETPVADCRLQESLYCISVHLETFFKDLFKSKALERLVLTIVNSPRIIIIRVSR